MANINKLFNGRNDAIKFVDDYGSMILEGKRKATGEEPETEPSKAKTKHEKVSKYLKKNLLMKLKSMK